jgi:Outer membrane lipoprotein carrier protein LolA-like
MISGAGLRARVAHAVSVLLLASLPAAAQEEPWDFARLMAELAQVQTSRARYSEVKRVAMLQKPLQLSGTLLYERPARIEKHQILPSREAIRVDGDRLTVEREGKTREVRLQNVPLIAALVESLRATLAGDGTELERLFSVRVEGTRQRWTLALTPREVEIAGVVKRIAIAGSGSRLARIEILEPGGDGSVMTIHEESP